ncbi:MAG: glycosyltransferase [Desulfobacteraceae bacterium]|nr:glycosyltransferase [Desulfobacteraceae bacterium]
MRPNDLDEIKLSILIVNFNTRELLRECLDSIYASDASFSVETIVVDRFSQDGTGQMVETSFPQVRLFSFGAKEKYSTALNKFLPLCNGKYIIISHADIVFLPDSLNKMVVFLGSNPGAGIVGANQHYPDQTFVPSSVQNPTLRKEISGMVYEIMHRLSKTWGGAAKKVGRWNHLETVETEVVWACYMVKKSVFDQIGLYDEDFVYAYTNNDLCMRAREIGWKVFYLKEAPVIHYEIQTPRKIYEKENLRYKRYGSAIAETVERDFFHFISKYYSRFTYTLFKLLKIAAYSLRVAVLGTLGAIGKIEPEEARIKIKGNLDTLRAVARLWWSTSNKAP